VKFPTKNQWRQFFEILTFGEKVIFCFLIFLFFSSASFLAVNFYHKKTEIKPTRGGEYREGVVGFPRFINPIYAPASDFDVDRDLIALIFSGLMKYDSKGNLQPDLVENYEILEGGKIYEFYLKKNLFWQDGKPLTADDVIFTIEMIQNSDVKSPLRGSWLGVEIEKISETALRFKLKNESSIFLENCTLKIIPKHIWENISPQNFPLATINLNPIGSGIYKLEKLLKDKNGKITSLTLVENPLYFGKKPYIPKITFYFFDSEEKPEEKLIDAFKRGEIKGFSPTTPTNLTNLTDYFSLYSFSLPRYFAVFFNLKNSKILSEKEVRQALNYGTNKSEILKGILSNLGKIVNSPILPDIYGFGEPEKTYQFDIEEAKKSLEKAGFKDEDGDGFREKIIKKEPAFQFKTNLALGSKGKEVEELQKCLAKDTQIYPEGEITAYFGEKTKAAIIRFQEKYKDEILKPYNLEKGTGEVRGKTREKLNAICFESGEEKIPLKFSLTIVDESPFIEVATILKSQWEKLGAEVEIKKFDLNTLKNDVIRKRNFETLLFGEILGILPDPFPFWHSSQKGEVGLNLANYENKKADELLETARTSLDFEERKKNLEEFQELIIEDAPAIFLYNPDYQYLVSKEIKGIEEGIIVDTSKRFSEIDSWYIKTRRVWK